MLKLADWKRLKRRKSPKNQKKVKILSLTIKAGIVEVVAGAAGEAVVVVEAVEDMVVAVILPSKLKDKKGL